MALANYLLSHALDDEIGSILSEYSVNFVPVVDNGPEAALAKAGDCSPANAARKDCITFNRINRINRYLTDI